MANPVAAYWHYSMRGKEATREDPFGGEMFSVCERLSDERWNGWQKWQYTSRSSNGDIVVIHFNYDGEYWYDDFKFVN